MVLARHEPRRPACCPRSSLLGRSSPASGLAAECEPGCPTGGSQRVRGDPGMGWCTSGRSDRDREAADVPEGLDPEPPTTLPSEAQRRALTCDDAPRSTLWSEGRGSQGAAIAELESLLVECAFSARFLRCSRCGKSVPLQFPRSRWSPRVQEASTFDRRTPSRKSPAAAVAASIPAGRDGREHPGPHRRSGRNPLRADAQGPLGGRTPSSGGEAPVRPSPSSPVPPHREVSIRTGPAAARSADLVHQGLGCCRRGDDRGAGWRLQGGSTGG
jgi:hypothetical protein